MLLKILLFAGALAGPVFAQGGPGPYAGQPHREIKALSDEDRAALLAGQGMGYAKPAELNGYPGPTHVLELAGPLQLTREQERATRKLLADHKEAARKLGAAVIEAERALDQAFASRRADEATVRQLAGEVARLQGELRFEHLKTHLAQAALLRKEQIAQYASLRGYAGQGGGGGHQHQHRH